MCLKLSFHAQANIASLLIFFYFVIDVYLKCNTEYIGFVITRLNKYYLNSGKYDQNAYIFVGIELFSYIFGVVLTLTGYHRQGSKVLFAMSTASTLLTYDVYQSGKFQSSGVSQVSKHFAISGGVLLLAAFLSQAGNLNSLKGKIKKIEALVGGKERADLDGDAPTNEVDADSATYHIRRRIRRGNF